MKKILLVEDDPKYLTFLKEVLILHGYQIETADNAIEGLQSFKENRYDLVISDLKMESVDGLQFLYLLRQVEEQVKVILLTSSDSEDDEIKGLELEVNEYIKKDASIKVLVKRIERVLSEGFKYENRLLNCQSENIVVDTRARRVTKNDEEVKLAMKEYEILVLFLKNRNVVLERGRIVKEVWQINDEHLDIRTIDTHVKRLRQKLKISCIFSVRGVGYEWVE